MKRIVVQESLGLLLFFAGCSAGCGDSDPAMEDIDGTSSAGTSGTGTSMGSNTAPGTDASGDATTNSTGDPTDPATSGGSSTSSRTTTGPTESTGQTGCIDNTECDGATPFCSAGACVGCEDLPDPDLACANESPDTPICAAGAGCVQCTENRGDACVDATPICDLDQLQCVGCTYHEECTTACNLVTGACMPDDATYWVRPLANNCAVNATGTFDSPFCTLQQAVDSIEQAGDGIGTIWLDPDGGGAHEGATIPGGTTIAIRSPEPNQRPQIGSGTATSLDVSSANTALFVDNVLLANATLQVVLVNSQSTVWFDRSEIVGNLGQALDVYAGAVHLRNSIVANNGRNSNLRAPIHVEGAEVSLLFTTVADNASSVVDSIQCDAASTVTVRNSIAIAREASSIDCNAAVDYSFIDTGGLGGNGNLVDTLIGNNLLGWFQNPGGFPPGPYTGQDYHLSAEGATLVDGVALVADGDIPFDIDLEARPEPGQNTTPGADLP